MHNLTLNKQFQNILLVNPPVYDFKCYDEWMLPLGLLYLSQYLRNHGLQTFLLNGLSRNHKMLPKTRDKKYGTGDFYCEEIPKPYVYQSVPRKYKRYGLSQSMINTVLQQIPKPDLIMVTSYMTYWYPGVVSIINQLHAIYPECPILLGGIYATLCHNHATNLLKNVSIIPGKHQLPLADILSSLSGRAFSPFDYRALFPDYTLVFSMNHGINHSTEECIPIYQSIERIPPFVPLLMQSGCPNHCHYCASPIFDPTQIAFSIESIKQIILFGHSQGIQNYVFYDDALLYNFKNRLKILLDWVLQEDFALHFHTPNALHAKYITSEVAQYLYKAGFKTIRIGFETADRTLQQKTGGKTTSSHFESSISHLQQAGFSKNQIGVYAMIGLPGQHINMVWQTMHYLTDFPVLIKPVWFSPIPGTRLFKQAAEWVPEIVQEPLLQNDAIFPFVSGFIDQETNQTLKHWVRQQNQA